VLPLIIAVPFRQSTSYKTCELLKCSTVLGFDTMLLGNHTHFHMFKGSMMVSSSAARMDILTPKNEAAVLSQNVKSSNYPAMWHHFIGEGCTLLHDYKNENLRSELPIIGSHFQCRRQTLLVMGA